VRVLRAVVGRGAPLLLLAAAACERAGELRVLADSTTAPGAVEVFAIPATGAAPPAVDPARLAADSLAALFRRTRAALVARADSLARADRRTADYAAAYTAYLADAVAAGRLRAARDSAARALPPRLPVAPSVLEHAVRAPITNGGATLLLRRGSWWIGAMDGYGGLLLAMRRVEIAAGARDTMAVR